MEIRLYYCIEGGAQLTSNAFMIRDIRHIDHRIGQVILSKRVQLNKGTIMNLLVCAKLAFYKGYF